MRFKLEGDSLLDAAEMLWICLANVSGGDWTKQSEEWQTAVKRWRDNYFNVIGRIKKGEGTPLTPEQVEGLKREYLDNSISDERIGRHNAIRYACSQAISHINANYWLIPKKEAKDET